MFHSDSSSSSRSRESVTTAGEMGRCSARRHRDSANGSGRNGGRERKGTAVFLAHRSTHDFFFKHGITSRITQHRERTTDDGQRTTAAACALGTLALTGSSTSSRCTPWHLGWAGLGRSFRALGAKFEVRSSKPIPTLTPPQSQTETVWGMSHTLEPHRARPRGSPRPCRGMIGTLSPLAARLHSAILHAGSISDRTSHNP